MCDFESEPMDQIVNMVVICFKPNVVGKHNKQDSCCQMQLKTEIVVTGFESDWEHFFSLRSPKAGARLHPDMAKLADELYEKLNSVNK